MDLFTEEDLDWYEFMAFGKPYSIDRFDFRINKNGDNDDMFALNTI